MIVYARLIFRLCTFKQNYVVYVSVYNNNVFMMTIAPIRFHFLHLLFIAAALSFLAGCAGPGKQGSRRVVQQSIVVDPAQRTEVVLTAMALLESRYKYGGTHPVNGFDCSGLVAYVFENAASQSLPHNTADIAGLSRQISKKQLKAGDFVFFNTLNRPFSHMGIYIGEDRFINAPSTGGQVRIDSLKNPYYAKRFESARTLFGS